MGKFYGVSQSEAEDMTVDFGVAPLSHPASPAVVGSTVHDAQVGGPCTVDGLTCDSASPVSLNVTAPFNMFGFDSSSRSQGSVCMSSHEAVGDVSKDKLMQELNESIARLQQLQFRNCKDQLSTTAAPSEASGSCHPLGLGMLRSFHFGSSASS